MLSLLYLRFTCGLGRDVELPPIYKEVAHLKECMEGLATLKQKLLREIPSCQRIFSGREYFKASLPLLALVKNFSLMKPFLDPACAVWGEILPTPTARHESRWGGGGHT